MNSAFFLPRKKQSQDKELSPIDQARAAKLQALQQKRVGALERQKRTGFLKKLLPRPRKSGAKNFRGVSDLKANRIALQQRGIATPRAGRRRLSLRLPMFKSLARGGLKRALILVVLGIISIVGVAYVAHVTEFGKVKTVRFSGEYAYLRDVQNRLRSEFLGQNLLGINTQSYVSELKKNPFVANVYIQKRYPAEIYIYFEENQPYQYLVSPNKAILYDEEGKVLSEVRLEDEIELQENDRLIYASEMPFKSTPVKNRWQLDKETELREKFAQQEKTRETEAGARQGTTGEAAQLAEQAVEERYKQFVDEQFALTPLEQIKPSYDQVRVEVMSLIDTRWQQIVEKLGTEYEFPIVYTLLEHDRIYNLQDLYEEEFFAGLRNDLTDDYAITKMEILSTSSIQLKVVDLSGKEFTLIFNHQVSLSEQLRRLETIRNELASKNIGYEKIDLSGQKVVVS